MKICDFEKKGNVIRLYYCKDSCNDYYGDDWDDTPWEHNAGLVYSNYIEGYVDFALPFEYSVVDSSEDWRYSGNSPYCKNDMKDEKVPCLLICESESYWGVEFSEVLGNKNTLRIYFNMSLADIESKLFAIGAKKFSGKETK